MEILVREVINHGADSMAVRKFDDMLQRALENVDHSAGDMDFTFFPVILTEDIKGFRDAISYKRKEKAIFLTKTYRANEFYRLDLDKQISSLVVGLTESLRLTRLSSGDREKVELVCGVLRPHA